MIRILHDPRHRAHDPGGAHPERPERMDACLRALEAEPVAFTTFDSPAAWEDLVRVHDEPYLRAAAETAARGALLYPDTPLSRGSFDVARRAAGACVQGARDALANDVRCLCLVRPPGHHAGPGYGMGFCVINSAAVAAAHARDRAGAKVAIVDFDVHHGNGTQEIFFEDRQVLYLSLHQWPWYPWRTGGLHEVGAGAGEGSNINIPLPASSDDPVYLDAIRRIVVPVLEEFLPDLVVVSAGYDAHLDDPLGLMEVTSGGFGAIVGELTRVVERVASRLILVLEGGYDLGALAASVVETARALTSGSPHEVGSEPSPPVDEARRFHARHWTSLGGDS